MLSSAVGSGCRALFTLALCAYLTCALLNVPLFLEPSVCPQEREVGSGMAFDDLLPWCPRPQGLKTRGAR